MRRFGRIGLAWFAATVVAVTIAAAAVGSVRSEVTDMPTALGVSVSPAITLVPSESVPVDETETLVRNSATSTTTTAATTSSTTTTIVGTEAEAVALAAPQSKSRPYRGTTSTTSTAPTGPDAATPPDPAASAAIAAAATTTTTEPPTTSAPTTTSPSTTHPTTTTTSPPTTTTTTTSPPTTTTTTRPKPAAYTRVIDTDGGSLSVRVDGDSVYFRRAFPKEDWRFEIAGTGPDSVQARFTRIDNRSVRIRVDARVVDGVFTVTISPSSDH